MQKNLKWYRPSMQFKFGIEHEVAFQTENGQYVDFSNTSFESLQAIVDDLPLYDEDYPQLRVGDAGIKKKRWYIEGFERFDEAGELTGCIPKGLEIRTRIHDSIHAAVEELTASFEKMADVAREHGYFPVLSSYNPLQPTFKPYPPLNVFEKARRNASPEKQTAFIPMMTQGPDLNISRSGLSTRALVDFAQKLTYYSPFIVPFTFSAPFYKGKLWEGLSKRSYERTGLRPAAMVFLEKDVSKYSVVPSLVKPARIASEVGRVEFKACDSCGDFNLYGALLALMKGMLLDKQLAGRAAVPDEKKHKETALVGFEDPLIHQQAGLVLAAARRALEHDPDCAWLSHLDALHAARSCQAREMKYAFNQNFNLIDVLAAGYSFSNRITEPSLNQVPLQMASKNKK
ncbi:MAG: glutamate--cysteine ligase [Bacteroidota bacterium]